MDRNSEERRPVNLQDRVYAIATARRGLHSARCNRCCMLYLNISADFVRHVLQQGLCSYPPRIPVSVFTLAAI